MPRKFVAQGEENNSVVHDVRRAAFAGFAAPTSNTTYIPNQFFDVCLPHSSRGTARIVAYMLRKTLGWCNADGEPREKRRAISYGELEVAGVARGMIRAALNEAVAGHFIRCLREGNPSVRGKTSISGLYELQWDERPAYVKDPRQFRGFFAGEGNRTYIPNQFFDLLVPSEPLAVIKVVGSVVRFSIGFQNKWGHRRRNVALSYQHLQNYGRIKDRTTLSNAVRYAMAANYIERVENGFFDPDGGKLSKAAVYALRWLNTGVSETTGPKSLPVEFEAENRSENQTGAGSKTRPADQFENQTDIEIKQRNKTLKQQAAASFELLRVEGFDARTAQAMADLFAFERIERQVRWLDHRQVKSNRLGLLRVAIEEDWPQPGIKLGRPTIERATGIGFGNAVDEARRRFFGQ